MKIIIIGAGEVGLNLCTTLAATGHNVTLIEQSELRCEKLDEAECAHYKRHGSSARQLVDVDAPCDALCHDERRPQM